MAYFAYVSSGAGTDGKEKTMADIVPFAALRPASGCEQRIAALPYDVYNREEARAAAAKDRLSFLNIDRPETQFPPGQDMYAPEVYRCAADQLRTRTEEGYYVQDETPCYYIYELTMNGRSQTGICACASVDDYMSGVIAKHENTRPEKEEDRIRHVDACSAQTGPIFLAYRKNEQLHAITDQIKKTGEPVFDFRSDDGIRHRGWKIDDTTFIRQIREAFSGMQRIYIADGHHRAASAVKVSQMRREAHPDYTGEEAYNYFLCVLFPDNELKILDYNRVIRDLNGLGADEFLKALSGICEVTPADRAPENLARGTCGLYLQNSWYRMKFHPEIMSDDPVDGLDVSVLQRYVLEPILGISDPRTDSRIDFVGGIRGYGELERRVHTDAAAAFAMHPTSMEELFRVADAHRLMPPKSTWFEPKLRSGLFIHRI